VPASFQIAPGTPGLTVGMMITLAVPDRVAFPEAVMVVATTAPVTVPVTLPTKPLVEVTGPEKVVEAMLQFLKLRLLSVRSVRQAGQQAG
jgi:hypothetical protein